MQAPTWGIFLGIFIMLIGGCSISKNVQAISMPEMLEKQQEVMEAMMESSRTDNTSDSLEVVANTDTINVQRSEGRNNFSDEMKGMFTMSEFAQIWIVRFGYIGMFVSLLYILGGLFLVINKKFSIPLVYTTLTIGLVFSAIQYFVLGSDTSGGFIAKYASAGNIVGIVIDLILLIVVFSMDKSAYEPANEEFD